MIGALFLLAFIFAVVTWLTGGMWLIGLAVAVLYAAQRLAFGYYRLRKLQKQLEQR